MSRFFRSFRVSSLRTQLLLIVLGGAVVPLGALSAWLTFTGLRSGERLLASHLAQSANQVAAAIEARWEYRRGDLLLMVENEVTTAAAARGSVDTADAEYLDLLLSRVGPGIEAAELTDSTGAALWEGEVEPAVGARGAATSPSPWLQVVYAVRNPEGERVGTLRAALPLSGLIPADSTRQVVVGARLGVRRAGTNEVLLAVDGQMPFPDSGRVEVESTPWLAATRSLDGPGLDIVLAAPLGPYVDPLRAAARFGAAGLILVSLAVVGMTTVLTTRVTRPLRDLANAADAVSRGDLDPHVAAAGPDEVRRVAGGFNVMTASLRTTLEELSRRSALAAVGEFATAMAHDVRNALTSIKVDVERVVHRPLEQTRGAAVLQRVLNNVARLDTLVSGALRFARGQEPALVRLDLREPLRASAEMVAGAFAGVPATLALDMPDRPVLMRGDATALQQLFANVLFNAAQAVRPGGAALVSLREEGDMLAVEVVDDGIGMDEAQLERVGAAGSSKTNGLGLPIARQIAISHGGSLTLSSRQGAGTTVVLRLPRTGG